MKLEPMRERHLDEVTAINDVSFDAPWSYSGYLAELNKPTSRYLVGIEDGKVVCFGGFSAVLDEADILNIAVKEEYRRKGYARALMISLIDVAKGLGVKKMTLEVRADNLPAVNLYESLGFTQDGIRKKYYLNKFDAVLMELGI